MGGRSTSTELKNILTPGQQQILSALVAEVLPQIGQAGDVFQGQIAPGVSPLQEQAFGQLGGAFGGETGGALSRLLGGQPAFEVDPAARERLYGAEQAAQLSQLQETFGLIEERAQAAGAGRSGSLQRSLGRAAAQTQLGLGQFYGGLSYADEQARRQAAESAAGRQVAGLGAFGGLAGQQLGAGQVQRGIVGQQNAEAYNKWLAAQPYANPTVSAYLPTILGTQAQTPVTTSRGGGVFSG